MQNSNEEKKNKVNKKRGSIWVKILLGFMSIPLLLALAIIGYDHFSASYKSAHTLDDYQDIYTNEVFISAVDRGYFIDGPGTKEVIIFYPGARVSAKAYIPLMTEIAHEGYDCYIAKMPLKLAVLNMGAADHFIKMNNENGGEYHYYLAGHSLGGAMAASYASKQIKKDTLASKNIKGLLLFAAYPTASIDADDFSVISIYGDHDQVLSLDKVKEGDQYMPKSHHYFVLEGGNHAQFGDYGKQKGDGEATLLPEVQRKKVAQLIKDVLIDNTIDTIDNVIETQDAIDPEVQKELELQKQIEEILSGMTIEEKILQMFIITPEALTDVDVVTKASETTKACYDEYPVGGFIYLSQNLENEEQTKEMLLNIQSFADERIHLPVFTCIDEEGGVVARIAGNDGFDIDNVGDMVDVETADDAYAVGVTIGTYLSDLGFNFDFAPDADVITNPDNKVIGKRSFGTDPLDVSSKALAVSKGLEEQNVLSTLKHYPGHGATKGDTHEGYAYTDKSYMELKSEELVPFIEGARQKVSAIMVAHICVPTILGDNTPCSLSKEMVTDNLRYDLSYDGLIVTDALNMGAIVNNYSASEAAIFAISAGDDLLLMPEDFKEAYEGVLAAVNNGEIEVERIDASVERIIRAKLMLSN